MHPGLLCFDVWSQKYQTCFIVMLPSQGVCDSLEECVSCSSRPLSDNLGGKKWGPESSLISCRHTNHVYFESAGPFNNIARLSVWPWNNGSKTVFPPEKQHTYRVISSSSWCTSLIHRSPYATYCGNKGITTLHTYSTQYISHIHFWIQKWLWLLFAWNSDFGRRRNILVWREHFWGIVNLWDHLYATLKTLLPHKKHVEVAAGKVGKNRYLPPKYRAKQFPNDFYTSGDALLCKFYQHIVSRKRADVCKGTLEA